VGKIETADVHAGIDESFEDRHMSTGGTDGGNNFRVSHSPQHTSTLNAYNHVAMNESVRSLPKRVLAVGTIDALHAVDLNALIGSQGLLIFMDGVPDRADTARRYFHEIGLKDRATVITGDPRRFLYKLAGPFDLIVVGREYLSLHDALRALLSPDGTFIDDGPS
jgi:predicted O-methyltransferase YrrM